MATNEAGVFQKHQRTRELVVRNNSCYCRFLVWQWEVDHDPDRYLVASSNSDVKVR
jgi:hypothetical protein